MKLSLLLFAVLLLYIPTYSQGLVFDDDSYQKMPLIPQYGTRKSINLPDKVDLSRYCPTPKHQGTIGSCVGWSIGYGAMTIMLAKQNGWTNQQQIDENAFSALFIYNQLPKSTCGGGTEIPKACTFVKKQGDILSNQFDNPVENCSKEPTLRQKQTALKWKIKEYNRLFDSKAPNHRKVHNVKKSIHHGKPVVLGMSTFSNFKNLKQEQYDYDVVRGENKILGGHAVVIVGYDDNRGGFKIMNSWGTEWGKGGFCWIYYEDFERLARYGVQLSFDNLVKQNNNIALSGGFSITLPTRNQYGVYEFPSGKVKRINKGLYQLEKNISLNQYFQLLATDVPSGKYVYVFSIDPNNNFNIHWPKNENYSKDHYGLGETSFVTYDDEKILIPGENDAMTKTETGKDFLCILYSDKRISPDFLNEKIKNTAKVNGSDFINRFESAFSDVLVPWNEIKYNDQQMYCETKSANGFVMPIILEISVY